MSKTNVFTLVATILLGILLFTILRFAGSLPEAPPAESIRGGTMEAPAANADVPEIPRRPGDLPRISTNAELQDFLDARGLDGLRTISDSAAWYQARGFFGANELLGIAEENARATVHQSLTEESLRLAHRAGDPSATQALAARVSFVDPFAALDLYRTAAALGSVYAVLRIGAVLESLADLSLDDYVADPGYLRKLSELRSQNAGRDPNFPAFSYALAAARDGGPPIIDRDTLQWMQRLSAEFPDEELHAACEQSSQLFLKFSVERRQNGLQPITTKPPPVFFSIPALEERLPCRTTTYPVIQVLDLSQCSHTPILDVNGEQMDLNICRN